MTLCVVFFNTILSHAQTTDTLVAYQHFVKADALLANDQYEQSITYFKKVLPIYKKAKAWERVARCYNKIAENQRRNKKYEEVLTNAKRALKYSDLYLKKNNREEAYSYDIIGNYYAWKLSDFKTSMEYCKKALKIREQTFFKNYEDIISSCISIGNMFFFEKKYDKGIKYYKKGLNIQKKEFGLNDIRISKIYFGLGLLYYGKEEYDKSLMYLKKTLLIRENILGKKSKKIATCNDLIGRIYQKKGNHNKALIYLQKRKSILISLYGLKHTSIVSVFNLIGISYKNMAKYDMALQYYKRAININEKIDLGKKKIALSPVSRNGGSMYNNIGVVYKYKGEYDKALKYYKKALQLDYIINGKEHLYVANTYNNIGNVLRLKEEYNQSLNYYTKALTIRKIKLNKSHSNIAESYNDIGELHMFKEEYDKAIVNINKALKIRLQMFDEIHPDVADSYRSLGNVYKDKKDYKTALTNYQKALTIRLAIFGERHPKVALAYNDIADIYMLESNFSMSIEYYEKAITANRRLSDTNNSYLDQNIVLSSLAGKARAYTKKYQKNKDIKDLKKAIKNYQKSDVLINDIRQSFTTYQDKVTFAKKAATIYQGAIASQLLLYGETKDQESLENAFYYSEKSKANILKELLAAANAKNYTGLPEEILALEKELRIDQAFYQSKITEERTRQEIDSSKVIAYENRLFDVSTRQDSLIKILAKDYPKYYQLKHKNELVSVTSIQQKLKVNTTLLEFFTADSVVYAFTISKDKLGVQELVVPELTEKVEQLNKTIITKDVMRYKKVAHQLYSHLITPVKGVLQGDELIIVPDGVLWHCNFELLLTQQDASNNPKSLSYLLKDYAISYANSASLLFQLSNTKSDSQEKEDCLAFSFSDSTNVTDTETISLATLRNAGDDLPGTRKEIREISEIIDGQYYFGSQAIESNFKQHANRYNVLHLALHGDVDHERPENSKLYFTKSKDTIDDNLLYAHELFAMNIPAALTVLSACNTGTGKIAKGEGIMSLGSAFQYAGTKSLLLSSWEVSDQTTPELMKYFYTNLKQGMNKAKALQQAQLHYLQTANIDRVHPWYWGGFYIVGDTAPIQFSSNTISWYWIVGVVLFILILGDLVYKKIRSYNQAKTAI